MPDKSPDKKDPLTLSAGGVEHHHKPPHPGHVPPPPPPPPDTTPASLTVSPSVLTLAIGSTFRLVATCRNAAGTILQVAVTWDSTFPGFASVDDAGLVTGVADGMATISARVSGLVGGCTVVVPASVPDLVPNHLTIAPPTLNLLIEETAQLSPLFTNAAGTVVPGTVDAYHTTDAGIAQVSPTGLVTGKGVGTAAITATHTSPALTSNGSIAVVTQPSDPLPPGGDNPNEPLGFTPIPPMLTGDELPPTSDTYTQPNPLGWEQRGVTQETDPDVPTTSKLVLQSTIQRGEGNGSGFAVAYPRSATNPQDWTQIMKPKRLYVHWRYRVSAGFPASRIANKMLYLCARSPGHYDADIEAVILINGNADITLVGGPAGQPTFAPNAGTPYTTPMLPFWSLQGNTAMTIDGQGANGGPGRNQNQLPMPGGGQDFTHWKHQVRDVWEEHEVLVTLNTPGNEDGGLKWWMNGLLIHDWTNRIKYHDNPECWFTIYWDTVYNEAVPNDAPIPSWHRLKSLYVSGSPTR